MKRLALFALVAIVAFASSYFALHLWQQQQRAQRPWQGTALTNPHNVNAISLVDDVKQTVTLGDYAGNIRLIFFGFVNCPDVCPSIMMQLRDVYNNLGEPEDLQVIMITVDPAHDTPEILGNYVHAFHADFIGLTGTEAQIAEAAKKFFIGYFQLPQAGQFSHTDSVALIDKNGDMRLVYTNNSLLRLEEDVARALAGQLP